MAETEIEAFNALKRLLEAASTEAAAEAMNAAASVYLEAARAAAPVGSGSLSHLSGQLRESIKIIKSNKSKIMSSMQGNISQRVFVGPEKKKGFYGYFVEKGHKTAGRHRIGRGSTNKTHSQKGSASKGSVAARPWFERVIQAAESRAIEEGQRAFNKKLEEIDSRR